LALAAGAIRPRKSLGQNFLVQERIAERIVEAAALEPGDAVVEIGPGRGILSGTIAGHPITSLTLIEKDLRLALALTSRFSSDRRITVIADDFLHAGLDRIADRGSLKIIGNLPFNVAAAILERLCASRVRIARMVLMFQREVADRIRARPATPAYGALSVFTALYWQIVDHFRVPAGNFRPRPKVDAAVLVFAPKADLAFTTDEEPVILATIRAGFAAPRKTIRNSIASGLRVGPVAAEQTLVRAGIDPSGRPGTLTVANFVALARSLGDLAILPGRIDA
jgi:16S rRNA (adenine1518-N6/adenine1519-N6)-dimethyltransferase